MLLVLLPVLVAAALFVEQTTPREIAMLCISLAFVLGLHVLLRRGHFALCAHALVFGFIAIAIAGLASYGSIRAPGSVALVAAITFGGIFLGRRTLFLAAILSVFALGCLVYAQRAGWLPQPDYRVTVGHWLIYGTIILAVALVLNYMRSLLVDLVRRQQAELAQRQKAETGQRQSEEHFYAAFTNSPDGILISRLRDGTVVAVNDAWVAINGYPREAVVGHSVVELGIWPRSAAARSRPCKGRAASQLPATPGAAAAVCARRCSRRCLDMAGALLMSLGRDVTSARAEKNCAQPRLLRP